ncbi:MAG: hypothetical protein ABFS86_01535 [Planctomycetota bacterium]
MKHKVFSWSCERGDEDGYEWLTFSFEPASCPHVSLKIWEDGAIWFLGKAR